MFGQRVDENWRQFDKLREQFATSGASREARRVGAGGSLIRFIWLVLPNKRPRRRRGFLFE